MADADRVAARRRKAPMAERLMFLLLRVLSWRHPFCWLCLNRAGVTRQGRLWACRDQPACDERRRAAGRSNDWAAACTRAKYGNGEPVTLMISTGKEGTDDR